MTDYTAGGGDETFMDSNGVEVDSFLGISPVHPDTKHTYRYCCNSEFQCGVSAQTMRNGHPEISRETPENTLEIPCVHTLHPHCIYGIHR